MSWIILNNGDLKNNFSHVIEKHGFPRVFLTGDGHRHPPFQWICQHSVYFIRLCEKNKLILHVEELSEKISSDSVPPMLNRLVNEKRVFSFELKEFAEIAALRSKLQNLRLVSASDPKNPLKPDPYARILIELLPLINKKHLQLHTKFNTKEMRSFSKNYNHLFLRCNNLVCWGCRSVCAVVP